MYFILIWTKLKSPKFIDNLDVMAKKKKNTALYIEGKKLDKVLIRQKCNVVVYEYLKSFFEVIKWFCEIKSDQSIFFF